MVAPAFFSFFGPTMPLSLLLPEARDGRRRGTYHTGRNDDGDDVDGC
jgi:hypothetical protein